MTDRARDLWSFLAELPQAPLGITRSPIEEWSAEGASFWVKRDDLNAPVLGGNKARALAYLLAGTLPGDRVATIGGVGSTHVLATAVHATRLGASVRAWRWPHELHPVGRAVSGAIERYCTSAPVLGSPFAAWLAARREAGPGERWIPFGGTSPTGMLGHLAGAGELVRQLSDGRRAPPDRLFVPLGTGGTAAGLACGLAAAGLETRVMAVRCGPRTGVESSWLRLLAWRLQRHVASLGLPMRWPRLHLEVVHDAWAGAYARPLPAAEALAGRLPAGLDATYSAKACYAAWRQAREGRGVTWFWHTFDARWLTPNQEERADAGLDPGEGSRL